MMSPQANAAAENSARIRISLTRKERNETPSERHARTTITEWLTGALYASDRGALLNIQAPRMALAIIPLEG